ncbi:MAG: cytosine deaminase [Ignavibacteria bacterium]|nr:cytosine deaminase [Ignavibacteria bacterium]
MIRKNILFNLETLMNNHAKPDEYYMQQALFEAGKALLTSDVPIGAVIVIDGEIIARNRNQVENLSDATAHAELLVIREAIQFTGYKHLLNSSLYVTLEPCAMCAGAMVLARIKRLVYGARDPKAGACECLYRIADDERLNHRCEVIGGVLEKECSLIIKNFFNELRNKK